MKKKKEANPKPFTYSFFLVRKVSINSKDDLTRRHKLFAIILRMYARPSLFFPSLS